MTGLFLSEIGEVEMGEVPGVASSEMMVGRELAGGDVGGADARGERLSWRNTE